MKKPIKVFALETGDGDLTCLIASTERKLWQLATHTFGISKTGLIRLGTKAIQAEIRLTE